MMEKGKAWERPYGTDLEQMDGWKEGREGGREGRKRRKET